MGTKDGRLRLHTVISDRRKIKPVGHRSRSRVLKPRSGKSPPDCERINEWSPSRKLRLLPGDVTFSNFRILVTAESASPDQAGTAHLGESPLLSTALAKKGASRVSLIDRAARASLARLAKRARDFACARELWESMRGNSREGYVKNSTYSDEFLAAAPDRFFEGYIAEQNMTGMSMGLAARGKVPFASTFACFFSRAFDFIRMAAISNLNVKFGGTHVGVSSGEDGPSQMGLEDIAMFGAEPNFTILYPSDATSAWAATMLAAEHVVIGALLVRGGPPNPAQILAVPMFILAVAAVRLIAKVSDRRGPALARPLLVVQFLLLTGVLIVSVIYDPAANPRGLVASVATMIAVSAMGCQFALSRLALPVEPSTAVMTSNLTNIVLLLLDTLPRSKPMMEVPKERLRLQRTLELLVGFCAGCIAGAAAVSWLGDWAWSLPVVLAGVVVVVG